MAAPNLQAEGDLAVVTTGDLTVTLPAHATNDILVVTAIIWAPNTATDLDAFPAVSGWTKQSDITITVAGLDGRAAFYWRRAPSGSETNPTLTRGANWDTGTDTCFSGRAYVIRGCATSGDPWDEFEASTFTTGANPTFPALTVNAAERMAVQFFCSTDNNSAGTASGWTAGTAVTTTTGSDAGFQTFRQDNISSSTTSGSSTASAPGQGQHGFFGVSFKPSGAVTGAASVDLTFGVDSAGKAKAYGAASLAVTVGIAVAGTPKAYGVSQSTFTLDVVSVGKSIPRGVSASTFTLEVVTVGLPKAYGASASTFTVGIDSAGSGTAAAASVTMTLLGLA